MSLTHCPLCIGLALLSVGRAIAHLTLLGLQLPRPAAAPLAKVVTYGARNSLLQTAGRRRRSLP
jgi:hypothetical protein